MERFTLPPLCDHHSHYTLYAALSAMPALTGAADRAAALELIAAVSGGPVSVFTGWNSSRYTLEPRDLGDEHPVIVLNLSLHGMVMNRAAVDHLSPDYPEITANHSDPLWTEKNLPLILNMIVNISAPSQEAMRDFGLSLVKEGIGAMEDMLLPGAEWLELSGSSPVKLAFWSGESVYAGLTATERSKVRGVKLFTDGALGTRTAALSRPFLSGEAGILLTGDESLAARLHGYMRDGTALAVHAIGDLAVTQAVSAVCRLRRERGCSGPVRIEHAQFITADDAVKARDAGITLSMQPNFSDDSVMYTDRLPAGFPALNNPFRMLIDEAGFVPGTDLLFGSDGMPHGMQHALQSSLFPPYPGQRLTIKEFIAGYCMPDHAHEWSARIEGGRVTVSPVS